MKTKNMVLSLFLLFFSSVGSHAASSTYCDGYIEGYKSVPGHESSDPVCPLPNLTENSTSAMLQGFEDGTAEAESQ